MKLKQVNERKVNEGSVAGTHIAAPLLCELAHSKRAGVYY
jgi:hypothetical protein